MPISDSPLLRLASAFFATGFVYYAGIYTLAPDQMASILEFAQLPSPTDRYMFDTLLALLAAKILFIAASIYGAVLFASKTYLGWTMLGMSLVPMADGLAVAWHVGHGAWNHWGYGSVTTVLGMALLGVFDGRKGKRA